MDRAADPLGLAGSLVTALVQYARHGAKRERAHALLLCVGFDAGRGQYCLWEPEPEPPPAEATADGEAAASARVPSYYYVAKTELARSSLYFSNKKKLTKGTRTFAARVLFIFPSPMHG